MGGQDGQEEIRLPGNVGGAVRIGNTVRRRTGPWTPSVHALLGHLAGLVPGVPDVLGFDEQGREILSFMPGRVIDIVTEPLSLAQVFSVARWTRAFHQAVASFSHPGPWRYCPFPRPTLIGHNDIAPYNVCFGGDEMAGVFDWDMAGPSTPLLELAFIAWNCVPLWRDIGPPEAAERLEVIAGAYDGPDARAILRAVPYRIQAMLDWIPSAAANGDEGIANLMTLGEPGRSQISLNRLTGRLLPAIDQRLS